MKHKDLKVFTILLTATALFCLPKSLSGEVLPAIEAASPNSHSEQEGIKERQEKGRNREIILRALKKELKRSQKKLKMEGHQKPYFISYQLKDIYEVNISGRYGAIYNMEDRRYRNLYGEVRVGDYKFDNTYEGDWGGGGYYDPSLPMEDNEDAFRNKLWLITDNKYKAAISGYLKKKGSDVYKVKEESIDSFSREKKHFHLGESIEFNFDPEIWKKRVREVSSYFKGFPEIIDSGMGVSGQKVVRYFVNTEGSQIVTEDSLYTVYLNAMAKAPDGMSLENYRHFFTPRENELPDREELMREVKSLIDDLLALREAPTMEPYSGPAILSPEVASLLFHEVVGHRLEGERQNEEYEGMTFKEKLGDKIIPSFLTIIDDPTLNVYDGISLTGCYRFDNEGVPAHKVVLIEDGVLKNFLLSRTPIKGFNRSNGHGRNSSSEDPRARMGNLIIRSTNELSPEQLKKKLISECQRQNKPFGFLLRSIIAGETNTTKFGFQAFKGTPIMVYKIYTEDGREELVRGVEIVGTPLSSINKILVTGNDYEVINSYCVAESGYIPISTIAPSILLSEIELQRTSSPKTKPPILSPPLFE
ncbi:MAG: TldD/PmbA family protein [Deltaproteobacteria bacterium]|nr:MAG: TldD/PmbA family protein [Deltaproteobacteria bacterium]